MSNKCPSYTMSNHDPTVIIAVYSGSVGPESIKLKSWYSKKLNTFQDKGGLDSESFFRRFLKKCAKSLSWATIKRNNNTIKDVQPQLFHERQPDRSGGSKGQLISKGLFGILNSSKERTKNFIITTMIPQVDLFSFVFWKNLRHTER